MVDTEELWVVVILRKAFSTRITVLSANQRKTCPSAYRYNSNINLCWKLEKGVRLNYFDAEERCARDGAHLFILNATDVIRYMQEFLAAGTMGTDIRLVLGMVESVCLTILNVVCCC